MLIAHLMRSFKKSYYRATDEIIEFQKTRGAAVKVKSKRNTHSYMNKTYNCVPTSTENRHIVIFTAGKQHIQ